MHNRTRIRQTLTDYLRENLEGIEVHCGRRLVLQTSDLPCVCVYTDQENHILFSDTPKVMKNTLDVVFEIILGGLENLDDLLDERARQIDSLLSEFDPLKLDLMTLQPRSTQVQYSTQGETLIGSLRITYEAIYLSEWLVA
jgi:hypothetical protein